MYTAQELSPAVDSGGGRTAQELSPAVDSGGGRIAGAPLERLVKENLDFVWRSLRRLGVPPGEVDDATQQVFLLANEKLGSIEPGRERAFLLGLAHRVASHSRRTLLRREAARLRFSEQPGPAVVEPELITERVEARDLLDRILDRMPPEVRTVFVLFELEDLSVDETARVLELPRGTVATRLRRARVLFKQHALQLRGSKP